jgi:hypothetical protein
VAQMVAHLPSKLKTLTSNFQHQQKNKKKEETSEINFINTFS